MHMSCSSKYTLLQSFFTHCNDFVLCLFTFNQWVLEYKDPRSIQMYLLRHATVWVSYYFLKLVNDDEFCIGLIYDSDDFLAAHQQSLIVEPGGHRITNLLETMWSQSWTSLSSSCLDKKLSVLFVTPILVMSSMTVHDQPENDIASTGRYHLCELRVHVMKVYTHIKRNITFA